MKMMGIEQQIARSSLLNTMRRLGLAKPYSQIEDLAQALSSVYLSEIALQAESLECVLRTVSFNKDAARVNGNDRD